MYSQNSHRAWKQRSLAAALFALVAGAALARPAQTPPSDAAPKGDAANGKQLFTDRGCADCHGDDAKGLPSKDTGGPQVGPPPVAFAAFVRQVRHPSGSMQPYGTDDITDAELADVYAYLVSLGVAAKPAAPPAAAAPPPAPPTAPSPPAPPAPPAPPTAQPPPVPAPPPAPLGAQAPVGGHPEVGRKLYASYGCNLCHGRQGEGSSAQPPGPKLAPPALGLSAFVAYVRQPKGQPKAKGSMPSYDGRVLPNADLVDIYAFLQSVAALQTPKP